MFGSSSYSSSPHNDDDGSSNNSKGAAVDYHLWATGVASGDRMLPDPTHRLPSLPQKWRPLPRAWYDEYVLRGDTIGATFRGQDNWHFGRVGEGAFSFQVKNAGGNLVIALTGWNHDDMNGYYIVLDDDNHESYVLKLTRLGNNGLNSMNISDLPMTRRRQYSRVDAKVYVDPEFRLNQSVVQSFWVLYQAGTIVVGTGGSPGQGKIILYMEPEDAAPNRSQRRSIGREMYHYAFAKSGSRWKGPITIQKTQAYEYIAAPSLSLPANPLTFVSGVANNENRVVLNSNGPLYAV